MRALLGELPTHAMCTCMHTCALARMQVIASCLESGAALDTDFTVVNGAGEFPEPAVLRQRLAAL